MMRHRRSLAALTLMLSLASAPAFAQGRPDPATSLAEQRDAMRPLAFMDGVWRGSAWTLMPSGEKLEITQTERIGPLLDGSIKLIEGRGYGADGRVGINAFATLSFDVAEHAYHFRSYAQGRSGDFPFRPTADGYVWEIPLGPQTTIRYTTVVKDGDWYEVGDRIVAGQGPARFFEMRLKRVGDTGWPAADAVAPK